MTHIGIDPGRNGALAAILDDGSVVAMPFDLQEYIDFLDSLRSGCGRITARAVVERVHAMPKQGVSSMFSFGVNYGEILGLLTACKIPHETVLPNRWKREFGVTADKNTAIAVAKRRFPYVSLRRSERCRTDSDGMAEALLMAEYCRRRS